MIRCPKCKVINVKNIEGVYCCNNCLHGWNPDLSAEKLYLEWVELDKSNRIVDQIGSERGHYSIQTSDGEKVLRRAKIAKELSNNHQHNLDLNPEVWYRIFQDAQ